MTFRSELEERCRLLARKYNYKASDVNRGFESLLVHIAASEPGFRNALSGDEIFAADLSDYILRDKDGGVDGVLENESDRELLLLQAHFSRKNAKPDPDKVRAFFQVVGRVTGPKRGQFLSGLNPQAQTLLGGIQDRLDQGWTISLRFVTNAAVSDDHQIRATAEAQQANYEQSSDNIACDVVGQDDLKRVWEETVNGARPVIETMQLKIRENHSLHFPKGKQFPTLVGLVSGNELRNLHKQHGNGLFALNIRLPMHLTKQVNPEIADTARENPESFFYFNNGVSAVCDSFAINKTTVTAKGFQIINGAQTVGTLGLLSEDPHGVDVLFRLTACGPHKAQFRDDITRTNNTQNQVLPWDFRSNDPIQRFLEERIPHFSGKGPIPQIYYRPKRGTELPGKGGKAIEPEYLGRLRHAYRYGPIVSYKEPKLLASTEPGIGKYWEAFGLDGNEVSLWTGDVLEEALCALALDQRLIAVADGYRKTDHAYGRWLKRLSRYVVGAVGEYRRHSGKASPSHAKLLKLSSDEFYDKLRPVLVEVFDKINGEYERYIGDKVQPEYKIARDQDFFERMTQGVIAKMTA